MLQDCNTIIHSFILTVVVTKSVVRCRLRLLSVRERTIQRHIRCRFFQLSFSRTQSTDSTHDDDDRTTTSIRRTRVTLNVEFRRKSDRDLETDRYRSERNSLIDHRTTSQPTDRQPEKPTPLAANRHLSGATSV